MPLVVKNPPANAGGVRDSGSIPRLGRSPGGGHSNPLQYSCLENLMDRGAWWATVHRVAKSWTGVKRLSTHAQVLEVTLKPHDCSEPHICSQKPQLCLESGDHCGGHMAGGFLGPGPVLCFDLSSRRVHPVSIYNMCVFFLLLLLFSCLVVSDSLQPHGL